jgi:predicted PurR-regulated permease PerM
MEIAFCEKIIGVAKTPKIGRAYCMELIIDFFKREGTKRFIILASVCLFLYLVRSILNLFLLTFIFTYLMYRIQNFLVAILRRFVRVQQRIIAVLLYVILTALLVLTLYYYIPVTIHETNKLISMAQEFFKNPPDNVVVTYFINLVKDVDFSGFTGRGFDLAFKYVTNIGNVLLALLLSLFFLLEKGRIFKFTVKFKTSRVSGIYNEIERFGKKFTQSFGKVLEAQFLIAFINSILSVIALSIVQFPQMFALGIMIFFLGLIPVAGVIISLIPLTIIAFSYGGVKMVLYVLVMIAVLHALEAYILNPKLMSSKTDLPVFYTVIILIVSEHFFGVWGLIIGIPVFIFLLDMLDVNVKD